MSKNQKAAPIGTAFWLPRTGEGGVALGAGVLSEPNDGDEKQRSRSENILPAAKALESLIVTCDESMRAESPPLAMIS
jgi:hypothetical protein